MLKKNIRFLKKRHSQEKLSNKLELPSENLFTGEKYRALRNILLKIAFDKSIKSFLVTSANHGEGKTASVINLGIGITDIHEYTVLLVETDLRYPDIHTRLGVEQSPGLIDVLKGKTNFDSAVKSTAKKNLKVLTSGTLNSHPSELFESSSFKELIKEAKSKFDIIIFDSPPILWYSDSAILQYSVDSVLLIVESGKTTKETIDKTLSILKNKNNNLLGIILNKHPFDSIVLRKRKRTT